MPTNVHDDVLVQSTPDAPDDELLLVRDGKPVLMPAGHVADRDDAVATTLGELSAGGV